MESLGVAIVGLGHAGRDHFTAWDSHPAAEVRALCAPSEARLASFPGKGHLFTADFDRVLEREDIHVVSICTPNYAHAEQAVKAVEAGKHVFCEKPLATSLEDCERIVEAVDRKPNVKFMVGQKNRFTPMAKMVKRLYDEGDLGEALFAEADYLHDVGNRIKDWWPDARNRHFALLGGGVHPVDLLRWIVGDVEVVHALASHKVMPTFPHDDAVIVNLRFVNGCLGKVAVFLGCKRPYALNLSVYGTKGTVINDRLYLSAMEEMEDFLTLPISILPEHPTFDEQMAHFVDCILGDKTPLIDARDGARSAAVCIAGGESIDTGKPVRVRNDFYVGFRKLSGGGKSLLSPLCQRVELASSQGRRRMLERILPPFRKHVPARCKRGGD